MKFTSNLYQGSLALLTDYYQLTMAYAYWKAGKAEEKAIFNLFFRKNPFQSGFTVAAGLEYVLNFCNNFRFEEDDLQYLREMKKPNGQVVFAEEFVMYLKTMKFSCSIEAIEEGTLVFPHAPLVKVSGPLIQCQLLETPLLNIINFQTLIATKATRITHAAQGKPVLEFGLRRAQGIDGALAASRAAYIGGCSATSNSLAGKIFGIPVSGTHAHSWIMSFPSELEAFYAYADAFPDHCVFLVDTYDTINGIKNAIEVGKHLRKMGNELKGIRIDSGDLAYFSNKAREMLDEAGFPDAKVVASNDLDEQIITSLNVQEASIDVWGVGTKLVTAYDQPALGAVYKLAALQNDSGQWEPKVKVSQQTIKINIPGNQQVVRFSKHGRAIADMICAEGYTPDLEDYIIIDPVDPNHRKKLKTTGLDKEMLLKPIFLNGVDVYKRPDIHQIRDKVAESLKMFDKTHLRLVNPHIYPVGLEENLHALRSELVLKMKIYDRD
jgi:nicotinate phosphoribosyltransferase